MTARQIVTRLTLRALAIQREDEQIHCRCGTDPDAIQSITDVTPADTEPRPVREGAEKWLASLEKKDLIKVFFMMYYGRDYRSRDRQGVGALRKEQLRLRRDRSSMVDTLLGEAHLYLTDALRRAREEGVDIEERLEDWRSGGDVTIE